MQPRFTALMRRDWAGRRFEVIGPLYSLDAIGKPIPAGSILTTTGEWGASTSLGSLRLTRSDKIYIRTLRSLKHRKGILDLEEWVKVGELLNEHLARPVKDGKRTKAGRAKENIAKALRAIESSRASLVRRK